MSLRQLVIAPSAGDQGLYKRLLRLRLVFLYQGRVARDLAKEEAVAMERRLLQLSQRTRSEKRKLRAHALTLLSALSLI